MPIPLDFLRGVLGALCIFFAHFLGRSAARVHTGRQRLSQSISWILRVAVTAGGVLWRRGFDAISIIVFCLAGLSLALGAWDELRPRREEDLTKKMFRDD